MSTLLTKSKFMNGLQCSKYLWLLFNEPYKVPPTDVATQHIFDEGQKVGELAKKLYPNGIQVPYNSFNGNLADTKRLLRERQTLFEPGFLANNIYSRLDILEPVYDDQWDIIEVKMSTEVKDEHIPDIAFQRFCCEKQGLKIRNCSITYINNKYIKNGDIDPNQLFLIQDVTSQVYDTIVGIDDQINYMLDIISSADCPDIPVGSYCDSLNPCPVITACKESLPDNTILDLYYAGKKKYELFNQGICYIKDIPADHKLTKAQQVQQQCELSCQTYVDKEAIKEFLNELTYPLYYLDFETFNSAIPMYNGSHPYQNIPFQFSVHVVETEKAVPIHHSYLADESGDPRQGLLAELKKVIGSKGSVIVYNQTFEKKILEQIGEAFPENSEWAKAVIDRIVDLYIPFRSFCYYNPQQKGSTSLKEVLPAVTGKSYKGMPITEGTDASLAFLELLGNDISIDERKRIRENLLQYCGLDTEGMIWITDNLKQLCL